MTTHPSTKPGSIRLEFTASELDTEDTVEWDHICDSIEAELRAARDHVLTGDGSPATVTIVIRVEPHH